MDCLEFQGLSGVKITKSKFLLSAQKIALFLGFCSAQRSNWIQSQGICKMKNILLGWELGAARYKCKAISACHVEFSIIFWNQSLLLWEPPKTGLRQCKSFDSLTKSMEKYIQTIVHTADSCQFFTFNLPTPNIGFLQIWLQKLFLPFNNY